MALTQTKTFETVVGSMRMIGGTFTEGAAGTSGDLRTGLTRTALLFLTPNSNTSPTEQCTVNTTLPAVDPITIGYTASVDGYWLAVGW